MTEDPIYERLDNGAFPLYHLVPVVSSGANFYRQQPAVQQQIPKLTYQPIRQQQGPLLAMLAPGTRIQEVLYQPVGTTNPGVMFMPAKSTKPVTEYFMTSVRNYHN
jgi:hypothetical protein